MSAEDISVMPGEEGIIISYFSSEGPIADVFNVAVSYKSVAAMAEEIQKDRGSWTIDDGSLSASKDKGQLTLTFKMQGPPFQDVSVTMDEEDSRVFIEGMVAFGTMAD